MLRVIVMGVTASGKTTVGQALAIALGGDFVDGDDLHGAANVEKMSHGLPLTDEDRWPWFDRIIARLNAGPKGCVIACSALKRTYRDYLRADADGVSFLYLDASHEMITARIKSRVGHFMPASLVESQFQTLERPDGEADTISIPADLETSDVIAMYLAWDSPK